VEWTPQGARDVGSKSYRYLSPVTTVDRKSRLVMGMESVALTNKPAILRMPALVNKQTTKPDDARNGSARGAGSVHNGESAMQKELIELLALPADASEEVVLNAVAGLQTRTKIVDGLATVAGELGDNGKPLAEALSAKSPTVETVANGLRTAVHRAAHPKDMVPATALEQVTNELKLVKATLSNGEFEALINANAARIPPANREKFRKWWDFDRAAAEEWVKAQPELVTNQSVAETGGGTGGVGDRQTVINSARAKVKAEPGVLWGGRTEREFVNGQLLAGGQKGLTDDEAVKLGI
jgi:phage I-like protein